MSQNVIDPKFLPERFPNPLMAVLVVLALDRMNAPGWVFGATLCLVAICHFIQAIKYFDQRGRSYHPRDLPHPVKDDERS
jgi:hypothetical protein